MVAGTTWFASQGRGSTKITQISMTVAGIDTAKHKLDIAVHGRTERWQGENTSLTD